MLAEISSGSGAAIDHCGAGNAEDKSEFGTPNPGSLIAAALCLSGAVYAHLEQLGMCSAEATRLTIEDRDEDRSPAVVAFHGSGPPDAVADCQHASDQIEKPQQPPVQPQVIARGVYVPSSSSNVMESFKHDDILELQKNLRIISDRCQFLAQQLKRHSQVTLKKSNSGSKTEPDDNEEHNEDLLPPCCAEVQQKLKAAMEENIRLRLVLKDVTEVNKRWQKYNKDRQLYMDRLRIQISELEAKIKMLEEAQKTIHQVPNILCEKKIPVGYRNSDSAILEQSSLRQSYESAVKENCRLQKQLEEQTKNLNSLLQQLETTRNESNERLQLLEVQVKSHKEDWDAERKEKEAAIAKLAKVLDELCVLRNRCRELDREQKGSRRNAHLFSGSPDEDYEPYLKEAMLGNMKQESPDPSAPELSTSMEMPPKYQSTLTYNIPGQEFQIAGNGPISRENLGYEPLHDFVIDNSPLPKTENSSPKRKVTRVPSYVDEFSILECPECHNVFPTNHDNFFEHLDACQATAKMCSAKT